MRTLDEPGWYVDALPTGEYACLIPGSHLMTHRGRVELPGANVLYLDLSADGLRVCGVGHQAPVEDMAVEWTGQQWVTRGRTVGPRSVIFDAQGQVLTVPSTGLAAGSQGYRQVADDGRIVLGDEAYADTARKVWEYTTRGDITIGQSGKGPHGEDAVIALYQGKRYVLAEGQCRFIKFRRAGDQLAVSWVQEDQRRSRVLWLTVAELMTFPEQRFEPSPVPTPNPQPAPVPEPLEEPVSEPASLFEAVSHVWNKYAAMRGGAPTHEDRGAILNEVAWQHRADGWGLSKKPGGANVRLPGTDILIAHDVLHHKPSDTLWDCFSDRGPVWVKANPHNDPNRPWVAPVGTGTGPGEPTVTTETDGGSLSALKNEIAALRAQVAALQQRLEGGTSTISRPLSVGIRSARTGKLLCNDANRPAGQRIQADDREGIGDWETWTLEPK